MNPLRFELLRLEDVAAVFWNLADFAHRERICREANISQAVAVLDWHDLAKAEQIPIAMQIKFMLEAHAAHMRQEMRNSIRMPG